MKLFEKLFNKNTIEEKVDLVEEKVDLIEVEDCEIKNFETLYNESQELINSLNMQLAESHDLVNSLNHELAELKSEIDNKIEQVDVAAEEKAIELLSGLGHDLVNIKEEEEVLNERELLRKEYRENKDSYFKKYLK